MKKTILALTLLVSVSAQADVASDLYTKQLQAVMDVGGIMITHEGGAAAVAALTGCLKGKTEKEKALRLKEIVNSTEFVALELHASAWGILACKTANKTPAEVVSEFVKIYHNSNIGDHLMYRLQGHRVAYDTRIVTAAMMVQE